VVLTHDGPIDSRIQDVQFTTLATSQRVVRYDRRGYGRSDSATAPYDPVEDPRRICRIQSAGVASVA
jgi:pimeloyl-ACP methyl ester carboxylesterase